MTTVSAAAIQGVPRPWGRATRWLLLLGPFFFLSYGAANWLASRHGNVGSVVFGWESGIPFVPWTIIPYWSIDLLYGLSLFVCTSERELDTHAKRLLTAQIVAVTCFILLPLTFTFQRPDVEGISGFLFTSLGQFDKPFNQAPSLHIALLVILWDRFARHLPHWASWPSHLWFALIGISVLTTYQHHFIDIPTGAALGFLCLWLWPDAGASPIATARLASDRRRFRLAAYYGGGGLAFSAFAVWLGGIGLWLFWPAGSLFLVALNYAVFGPDGFQKSADGRLSRGAMWLLGPYVAAAWVNSRLWTRDDPAAVLVADDVWLGRLPSRGDRSRFAAVVDLCAELPGPSSRAIPMLDLIVPAAEQLASVAGVIEQARLSGPVLVCCALGYGRSAAAVAAWLLLTGRAQDAEAAMARVRRARPRAVLRPEIRDAIIAAGARS